MFVKLGLFTFNIAVHMPNFKRFQLEVCHGMDMQGCYLKRIYILLWPLGFKPFCPSDMQDMERRLSTPL